MVPIADVVKVKDGGEESVVGLDGKGNGGMEDEARQAERRGFLRWGVSGEWLRGEERWRCCLYTYLRMERVLGSRFIVV